VEAQEADKEKAARFRVRVSKGDASLIVHVPKEGAFTELAGTREHGGADESNALVEQLRKAVEGMPKEAQTSEVLVDELVACCRAAGLMAERMPEADASVTVVLDMDSGRTLTRSETLPGGVHNESVEQSVKRAVQTALRKMARGDASEFCSAVEASDLVTAKTLFPRDLKSAQVPRFIQAMEIVLSKDEWREEHVTMGGLGADLLLRAGALDAAERFAKRTTELTKEVGDDEQAFALALLLGNIQVERGRLLLGLEHYAIAEGKQQNVSASGRAWLHHNRGSVLLQQSDFDGAVQSYRLAAQLRASAGVPHEPAHTLARAARGMERRSSRRALGLYQEALSALPMETDDAHTRIWIRGHILEAIVHLYVHDLHEFDLALAPLNEAIELFRGILEASTSFTSLLKMKAYALEHLGRQDEAAAAAAECAAFIAANPDSFHAHAEKILNGEVPDGPELNRALGGDPRRLEAGRLFREATALGKEDPLQVVALVERAVDAVPPDSADSYALRSLLLLYAGEVLRDSGRAEPAIQYASRAWAEYPAGVGTAMRLARWFLDQQRLDEAFQLGERLTREHPEDHRGPLLAGHAADRAGDFQRALTYLERAARLTNDRADIRTRISDIRDQEARGLLPPPRATLPALPSLLPSNDGEFLQYLRDFARRTEENSDAFWKSRADRRWNGRPEAIGRGLLIQSLKEHGSAISCFREVEVAGGRMDLTVNVLGRNYIVELKMCGPGYSQNYAEGGFDQLKGYMKQFGSTRGFLVVFDGRKEQVAIPAEVDLGDGMLTFAVLVNVLGIAASRQP